MIYKTLLVLFLSAAFSYAADGCPACHSGMAAHYADYPCTSCHSGIDGTGRKNIAHTKLIKGRYAQFLMPNAQTERGEKLVERAKCRRCHFIDGKGNNIASRLDYTVKRLTPEEILNNLTNPNDQMPQFNFAEDDLTDIVVTLLHYSAKTGAQNFTEVIYFTESSENNVFNKQCGKCHRLLSSGGAFGQVTLAPFLSGLYSKYYPGINGEPWDEKKLSEWIDNPRIIKKSAIMPVIKLTPDEKSSIIELFRVSP